MMKQHNWRPRFEALESVTLFSCIAAEFHVTAQAALTARPPLPNPLPLAGSMHGPVHNGFTAFTANGSGSFANIGQVTFKMIGQAASPEAPIIDYGSITISSKRSGKLFVDYSSSDGEIQLYQIARGTKAFANETGSGTFVFSNTDRGHEVTLNFN